AFVSGDVVTCTVTPDDGTDTGSDVSASVTVDNTAPVLGAVSISPATAYNDDLLTCSASATDADGGSPSLSYAWTNSSSGSSIGSGSTLSLTSALAASRESVACAVTATDADGGSDSGSASLTLSNRAPVAAASLSPSSPTASSTLTCSGSATDADADSTTLSFAWTVNGSTVSATSTTATSSTLAGAFAAGQLVACTVTATDGKTGTDTDTASVTIQNTAPTVSVSLSPATVYTNDTLTATATTADADGDALTVSYDWYVNGTVVQSGASSTLSGAAYFDRDESVYVVATTDDGLDSATATSRSVTVSNTAPTAPEVEITPEDAEEGDDLTCTVVTESTDADGDAITYSFAWDVDGVDYTGATDSAAESVVDGAEVGGNETWTCDVVAEDSAGGGATATASVTTGCATGASETCAASSCADILGSGSSLGDGVYWVDPDGSGALRVYCDMTTDGGGWQLIAQGGGGCASRSCSTSMMGSVSEIDSSDTCSYLNIDRVMRLAGASSEVALRVGSGFGTWESSATSTNSLAIEALRSSTTTWHNGATFDNWNFYPVDTASVEFCGGGWPNMYHSLGYEYGVHWIVGDGHDRYSRRSYAVTTTWTR
ncbi:MAG: hypothetical protein FJ090_22795, partial [Deltaproteobacteria bacterium]|nr:hypothetical protein [Deltaproteobacteria bacterium]